MTISYGYGGFAPATAHQNVKKVWDKLLHEQVLNKSAWKGMIGVDKGGEGSLDEEVVNKPIVMKTQLGKESGDQITMGLVASNVKQAWTDGTAANNWYNMGKTGNSQLVDNENSLTLYNTKVKVAHHRFGVQIDGKTTLIRTPYDLLKVGKDRVAEQQVYSLDSSIFFALYAGYSHNVFRELGVSAAVPTNHPNRIFGKGQASAAAISASDIMDTEMLEIIRVFRQQSNLNPIYVDGDDYHLLYITPLNGKTLRHDSAWVDANAFAQPRGNENPIFQNKIGMWGGIVVKETNKLSTGLDFSTVTVTSDSINAITAETFSPGTSATNVFMCVLMGANAVARAFALESYMTRRKEDDYENIYGFAGGSIYGDRRGDFQLSQDSGTDGATKNQSSAIVYAFAEPVTVPTVWS